MKLSICILAAMVVAATASCDLQTLRDNQAKIAEQAATCSAGEDAKATKCQQEIMMELGPEAMKFMGGGEPDPSEIQSLLEKFMKKAVDCLCPTITTVVDCFNGLDCYGAGVFNKFTEAENFLGSLTGGIANGLVPGRRRNNDEPAGSGNDMNSMFQSLLADATKSCPAIGNLVNPPSWDITYFVTAPANFNKFSADQLKAVCIRMMQRIQPPSDLGNCDKADFFKYSKTEDGKIKFDVSIKSPFKPGTADLFLEQTEEEEYTYETANGNASSSLPVAQLETPSVLSSAFAMATTLVSVVAVALLAM